MLKLVHIGIIEMIAHWSLISETLAMPKILFYESHSYPK